MSDPERVARRLEEDHVALLTLRNPPVNALSRAVLEELGAAIRALPTDARAVVLTGEGTYFSAGADLKEMASVGLDHAPELIRRGHEILGELAAFPAPVIAAINGIAVGGGLELALACDIRIAGDSAKLGLTEVGFGLMPAYGGTQRLPRLVGPAKAGELIFSGNLVTATEAQRIGLVNQVVPAGQELAAARDLAHQIARRSPLAVSAAKRAIASGAALPLSEGLRVESDLFAREVLGTRDLSEGITAFTERRAPRFTGQ